MKLIQTVKELKAQLDSYEMEQRNVDINDSIKKCEEFGLKVKISKNAYSTSTDKEVKIKEKISDLHDMIIDKNDIDM